MSMTLFRCILSRPVKAADAVLTSAPVSMNRDVIWMSWAISGRWKMSARKPEMAIEKRVSASPRISSKAKPETSMLLIFSVSFWWLYWALYLTMAVVMPQSLKVAMRLGAPMAIV